MEQRIPFLGIYVENECQYSGVMVNDKPRSHPKQQHYDKRTIMNKLSSTTQAQFDDSAKLLLRATLAILILFHGVSKLIGGAGFITGMVAQAGLPAALGYLVYVGEVVAPLMVLLGLWARAGAVVIAGNMVVAILLAHTAQLAQLNDTGGYALELQMMFLFGAVVVALLGAGRYSLGKTGTVWN